LPVLIIPINLLDAYVTSAKTDYARIVTLKLAQMEIRNIGVQIALLLRVIGELLKYNYALTHRVKED